MWVPETGGANVPALNDLLTKSWGIAFGDKVLDGSFSLGQQHSPVIYSSGTVVSRFPEAGFLLRAELRDQGEELLRGLDKKSETMLVPILGLLQVKTRGRIAVYGDSNCLDDSHAQESQPPCFWMLDAILEFVSIGKIPSVFLEAQAREKNSKKKPMFVNSTLPQRMKGNKLHKYSKVLKFEDPNEYCELPACSKIVPVLTVPLNRIPPATLYKLPKLLSIKIPEGTISTKDVQSEDDMPWSQRRGARVDANSPKQHAEGINYEVLVGDNESEKLMNSRKLQSKMWIYLVVVLLITGLVVLIWSCGTKRLFRINRAMGTLQRMTQGVR